ncbi:MAG: hypothetical protein MUE69_16740 [Myxococcota bacterium]|jgi:hypothetical protein|nr:hypothetical protein [Myxococcota bacterium]
MTSALTDVEAATLAHRRRVLVRGSAVGFAVMVAAWFIGLRTAAVSTFALPVAFALLLRTYMRCPRCNERVVATYFSRALAGRRTLACPCCDANLDALMK